jgi:hypothetical protein
MDNTLTKTALTDSYFKHEDAFGTILYKLCLKVFGEEFPSWELETITMCIKDMFGEIPDINLDKIYSIVALVNSRDGRFCFFNELNCFRHTVNVLNNFPTDYNFLGSLTPQHIHWAIYEVDQLYPGHKLDEDPLKFLGLSYHHIGALVLPMDMEEYQEFLNLYNTNSHLVPHIKEEWSKLKDHHPDDLSEEHIVEMQILMLKADEAYMNHKKQLYQDHSGLYI